VNLAPLIDEVVGSTRLSGSSAFSVPKRAALATIMSVSPMMALSGVRRLRGLGSVVMPNSRW
jgi:hypothetical protein